MYSIVFQNHPLYLNIARAKNRKFVPDFGVYGKLFQVQFTNGYQMIHKALRGIEHACCLHETIYGSFVRILLLLYSITFQTVSH